MRLTAILCIPNRVGCTAEGQGRAFLHEELSLSAGLKAETRLLPRIKGGIRKGARVHHAVFGPGTVLELQGSGAQQKAKILFRGSGEKTLMVQYANLKVLP